MGPASPTSPRVQQPQSAAPSSPLRPSPMPRAHTLPSLLDPKAPTKAPIEPLKIDTAKAKEESIPEEICLSPSWSDHGEKKRRKEKRQRERDQKELEKRDRQDEDRQRGAEVKAGRRLSKKPPPAAMETQKMPNGLRRNSLASLFSSRPSSIEGSRRNSQSNDEKRLSGVSLASFKSWGSQQTPATSTENTDSPGQWRSTVSPSAPRLPSFRWHSKKDSSTTTSKSLSWGSDDAYDKDVVEFAYRLDASAFSMEPAESEQKESKTTQQPRSSHFKEHTGVNGFSRSITEPNLTTARQDRPTPRSPKRPPPQQRGSSDHKEASKEKPDSVLRDHNPKARNAEAVNEHVGRAQPNGGANHRLNSSQDLTSPMERPPNHITPSHDGSSYVHKQRMYEQQMSIAGFEDQQAVQLATELAAQREGLGGEQRPSTDKASRSSTPNSENTANRDAQVDGRDSPDTTISRTSGGRSRRDSSPRSRNATAKQFHKSTPLSQSTNHADLATEHQSKDGNGRHLRHARESVTLNTTQAAPGSKTDRILGFRRRTKLPPSKICIPDDEEKAEGQQKSVSVESSQPAEHTAKRSRIEKMITDPLAAHIPFRNRRDSASSAGLAAPPSLDENQTSRGHSRTRTTSSQALTESIPSPMPQPSAATAPKPRSSKAKEQPSPIAPKDGSFQGGKKLRDADSAKLQEKTSGTTSKATTKVEAEPANIVTPAPKTSNKAKPHITALTKPAKAEPEVIVESMTSDGLIRKTSITRAHSQPHLQTQTTVTNSLPSFDFLPQLKHQPLVKSTKYSPPRTTFDSTLPQFPAPLPSSTPTKQSNSGPDLPLLLPRSPLRPPSQFPTPSTSRNHSPTAPAFNRSSTSIPSTSTTNLSMKDAVRGGLDTKPVAKLFVICCKCKFWHDLPSKLYEAMALSKELHRDEGAGSQSGRSMEVNRKIGEGKGIHAPEEKPGEGGQEKGKKVAQLDTAVKCPWCEHAMTTWCCQGWTTVVYMHQRHH